MTDTASSSPARLGQRLRVATAGYPRQFWLLFGGLLMTSSAGSMVWPFLTIYMRQRLEIPLTTVTLLLTLNSLVGMAVTFVAGPAVDRFGRKGAMLVGLLAGAATMIGFSLAQTVPAWAFLVAMMGAFNPLYGVASNAMIADLVPEERRAGAYSLLRMISNLGVAIGPAVGGFVASVSYLLAFRISALANLAFFLLILLFVRETRPEQQPTASRQAAVGGYGQVLHDRRFMSFCAVYTLASMSYSVMMVLLSVYTKENFGVVESQFGFIMSANALLVVLFQYPVTSVTKRFRAFSVLAVGAGFYALGVGSVAWGASFLAFLLSMVILTIGEMIIVPTSTTLTASLSPVDMRGRYMSVYSLTWSVGFAVGPVAAGFLNDAVAPVAIWYSGMMMALLSALGFAALARVDSRRIARRSQA